MSDTDNILLESVSTQDITDAIKKRYEVKIKYDNGNGNERLIEPVAYGISKAGNPVLRAFQPFGDTKTKVPHWKLFRVDKIIEWKPLKNRKFTEPPAQQWNAEGKYNPNGDKEMKTVYLSADFNKINLGYEKGLKKYNAEVRRKKEKENPFYGLKKNIEKSIMATPEIMKRVEEWNRQKAKNSAKEMASINKIGNETVSSNGVVAKNDNNNNANNNSSLNYNNINNNGPIVKGQNNNKDESERS